MWHNNYISRTKRRVGPREALSRTREMFLSVVPQEYTASGEKGHNVRGSKAEKEVMMADGVSNTVSPK
jgi:hypothetical protein